MTTATLSRALRARQSAVRCDGLARNCDAKAARYPEGSAGRSDWASLAADYRATADEWRRQADADEANHRAWQPVRDAPRRQCSYCPKRALPGGYECAEHDDL